MEPRHRKRPPERFFTIPTTGMTLPRLALSVIIPYRAIRGKSTKKLTAFALLSDSEGKVGRIVDWLAPDAGLGCSKPGKELDYGTDGAYIAGAVVADVAGKNSHPASRIAGVITGFKVGSQARWARSAMREYRQQTGERLVTDVGFIGKCATAFTLAAEYAHAASRDTDRSTFEGVQQHRDLAYTGLAMATAGLLLGRISERQNDQQFQEKLTTYVRPAA